MERWGPKAMKLPILSTLDVFDGGESTKYITLFGNRIARLVEESTMLPGGESYFLLYISNHLGSSSLIIDSSNGDLIESRLDLPYGNTDSNYINPYSEWNNYSSHYTFSGKERDHNTDIFYFGARYFNPLLGRWISADPLECKGKHSCNAYSYANHSPLIFIDPNGLLVQLGYEINQEAIDVFPDGTYNENLKDLMNKDTVYKGTIQTKLFSKELANAQCEALRSWFMETEGWSDEFAAKAISIDDEGYLRIMGPNDLLCQNIDVPMEYIDLYKTANNPDYTIKVVDVTDKNLKDMGFSEPIEDYGQTYLESGVVAIYRDRSVLKTDPQFKFNNKMDMFGYSQVIVHEMSAHIATKYEGGVLYSLYEKYNVKLDPEVQAYKNINKTIKSSDSEHIDPLGGYYRKNFKFGTLSDWKSRAIWRKFGGKFSE